mmetsp:Transcript_60056/g.157962  ORF Transcript_60056/g.157962 Transcript_60056/m.157962 type:complete len:204 (+) Transcript_60056:157-768(+)
MPSACMTGRCAGFFMSIAKSRRVKSCHFFGLSVGMASNWQWSKTGTGSQERISMASRSSPPPSARWYIMSETKPKSASFLTKAFMTSISPRAVSPCFPRSRSKKVTSSESRGTPFDWMWYMGSTQACGESRVPAAQRLPLRSARLLMPASLRTRMSTMKLQSASRMPRDRLAFPVRLLVRTCASGPFQAMSIWPAKSASTCRS